MVMAAGRADAVNAVRRPTFTPPPSWAMAQLNRPHCVGTAQPGVPWPD